MKLEFQLYGRQPLGRLIEETIHLLTEFGGAPTFIALDSRQRRRDLPVEETLSSARQSAWDTCEIGIPTGSVEVSWNYGPVAHAQGIWGSLRVDSREFSGFQALLSRLATLAGVVYGYCDREAAVKSEVRQVGGGLLREESLYGVYWLNYFGPEMARQFPAAEAAVNAEVRCLDGDALLLVLGDSPDAINEESRRALAATWPVFEKYRSKARFPDGLEIDYSPVRILPVDQPVSAPIASIVGEPDEFILRVGDYSRRFEQWCDEFGERTGSFNDLNRVLERHGHLILDDPKLLILAVAAYGESVRREFGGTWRKAVFVHRGEPVVVRKGRPWTARRVILEVLEILGDTTREELG